MIQIRHLFIPLFILFTSCISTQQTATTFTAEGTDLWEASAIPQWYNPADFDTISVLTWNIEHFVDEFDDPYIDNSRENNPTEDLPERRRLLAEAIEKLDPDIVVFQEAESASYIQAWSDQYLDDMGYRLYTSRESNDWYMNVIVMSRIPLGMLYSYANITTEIIGETDDDGSTARQHFTNNRMLSVDVFVRPDYSFTLTGVHLKAGRGDRNEGWRMGQIHLLRAHYRQLINMNPDTRILMMGDFNMIPGHSEYDLVLGEGSGIVFIDPFAGRDTFTHTADQPQRQLDYIFPNQKMMEDLVPGSAEIPLPFDDATMRKISDHLPVMARFHTRTDHQ